eukprot:6364977-Pyramimonas_sp.AAC.2
MPKCQAGLKESRTHRIGAVLVRWERLRAAPVMWAGLAAATLFREPTEHRPVETQSPNGRRP